MNEDYSATVYYYNPSERIDHLVRVKESDDNTGSYDVQYIGDTENVAYTFVSLYQTNVVLINALANLWKTHQYDQEYKAFLLGTYTKDEFKEIAEQYAEPMISACDKTYIENAYNVLTSALKQNLTTIDLSLLLNVGNSCINTNLKLLDYLTEE